SISTDPPYLPERSDQEYESLLSEHVGSYKLGTCSFRTGAFMLVKLKLSLTLVKPPFHFHMFVI
ncbi:hypothetical protein, partial [Bacillus haynesii]|uniref:hypothetical protein n=1 Tax=Bacillus haynesii TaxID=1925021 RepID=UPI001969E289